MSTWAPEKKAAREQIRARIHQLIADNPGITSRIISDLLGMPVTVVSGHVSALTVADRVTLKGNMTATGRPRGPARLFPVASPAPRPINKGGAGNITPMPDDQEHRAWMEYWKAHRERRLAQQVNAMRGRV